MKIGAIIEARMSSTRLPGKVLFSVKNKTMLELIINRIKLVRKIDKKIIATTTNFNDDKLVKWCKSKKISFYRGSEHNVLNRVYLAAKKYKLDVIVLITGDCPLVDHNIISQVLLTYLNNKADYVSNAHIRTYPDGMDVQVINFNSLKKSTQIAKSNLEKEHVTLNIRRNPKIFKHLYVMAPEKLHLPKLGLTLDEKEDFILIKKIINHFYKKKNYSFSCEQIVDLLKIKKNWIKINSSVKRKGDT
jgi:spore coat polysaccharide biosynthesis protein SpsF